MAGSPSRRRENSEIRFHWPAGTPSWGLGVGLTTPPRRKTVVTETDTTENSRKDQRERPGGEGKKRASQTFSREEADLRKNFSPPRLPHGLEYVRTMYETGKAAQVARDMDKYRLEILGLSEVRWTSSGQVNLASGHQLLYSGPSDEERQEFNRQM